MVQCVSALLTSSRHPYILMMLNIMMKQLHRYHRVCCTNSIEGPQSPSIQDQSDRQTDRQTYNHTDIVHIDEQPPKHIDIRTPMHTQPRFTPHRTPSPHCSGRFLFFGVWLLRFAAQINESRRVRARKH
jgi:hypothetical protein